MCREIKGCRICGNQALRPILDLGEQYLTGVFPSSPSQPVSRGPLELVKCHDDGRPDSCGLVQLRHSYQAEEMYGMNYGYRSALNRSMVNHLHAKAELLARQAGLCPGDLVLDIGSNDGTLLSFYPSDGLSLVGMDPSAVKFRSYYRPDIHLITDFFSAKRFQADFGSRKARLVTSIAMFYDLDDPLSFVEAVREVLEDDGLWHLEQSYLPLMLQQTAYDTICHEHVEYYCLRQIKWMTDRCGLKIIDVTLNAVNGGSFAITVAKEQAPYEPCASAINALAKAEEEMSGQSLLPYEKFANRVFRHRAELQEFLGWARTHGLHILGYGASTKGNVILQFCNVTRGDLPAIAEVNKDKVGCFTPGTAIPIISEAEAHATNPDFLLVLPWHFRDMLLQRESAYLRSGGRMVFPLPRIDVVDSTQANAA